MKLTLQEDHGTVTIEGEGLVSATDYTQVFYRAMIGLGFAPCCVLDAFEEVAEYERDAMQPRMSNNTESNQ